MPAGNKRFGNINLVPQDEFDRSTLGKILKWSLSAGKSIVVITEFVVILAFLSRFKLDRDLNDLNEVTAQKSALVSSFAATEERMRDIQSRIAVVDKNQEINLVASELISEVKAMTPFDVSYESISFRQGSIDLVGSAGSEVGFATLLQGFSVNPNWGQITLGDTQFTQRKGGVLFGLKAVKVEEGGKNE